MKPFEIDDLLVDHLWLTELARHLVGDEHEAADLIQDTWVAALAQPPQNDAAGRSWLRTVLQNAVRFRHRSLKAVNLGFQFL